jgi:hypothetical protein
MSENRGQVTGRIGSAQNQAAQGGQNPPGGLPSWLLNLVVGCILGAAIGVLFGLLTAGRHNTAVGIGFLVWFVAGVATEFLPFNRWYWKLAGLCVGFAVVLPLAVTPKCGWYNDQCKPVQQVRHAK